MEENAFPKKLELGIAALLLIGGIALYVVWGFAYGSWNMFDVNYIGLYSLVIVMVLFGIFGILLARRK